jgi:transcriptional regulator with XRE-family HTH domain
MDNPSMKESLRSYIQNRANEQGLSLSEVCRQANISRQTLYSLDQVPHKLPALQTLIGLASVLAIHPLRLLHLVFDELPMTQQVKQRQKRGDESAFIQETIPDGTLVLHNQTFTKTWEVQNIGRVPWENRYLQCVDEELVVYTRTGEALQIAENLIPSVKRIPVPNTAPGATVKLSVELTAPAMPGTCISYWKLVFEDGSLCFPKAQGLSVKVRVSSLATGAFAADARLV